MEPASLLAVTPTLPEPNLLDLPRRTPSDRWCRAVSTRSENRKSGTTSPCRPRTSLSIEELRATARLYAFGLDPVPDLPIPAGTTGLSWVEFARLADKYYLRLFKDARKYGSCDEDTASDLVQETLAALAEGHHSFCGDSKPYTWMHATLRNKIRDYLEKEQRLRRERACALAYLRRPRKPSVEDDQEEAEREGTSNKPLTAIFRDTISMHEGKREPYAEMNVSPMTHDQQDVPDDDAEALAEIEAEKVDHTILKSVASVLPDPLAAPPDALELAMLSERREALLKARRAVGVPDTIWAALRDVYVMDESWSKVGAKLNFDEETLKYEARKELLALREYLVKLGYEG
jgi:RNA polymerase sigma factor (sigma-70 family)